MIRSDQTGRYLRLKQTSQLTTSYFTFQFTFSHDFDPSECLLFATRNGRNFALILTIFIRQKSDNDGQDRKIKFNINKNEMSLKQTEPQCPGIQHTGITQILRIDMHTRSTQKATELCIR